MSEGKDDALPSGEEEAGDEAATEFALDQILSDRRYQEYGTPPLKRKSYGANGELGEGSSGKDGRLSVKRSPLSTFKLMSQTIAEYGEMIAQRRTEIAELQRTNNIRLSSSAYSMVRKLRISAAF
jgi:hypothetical protein